MALFGKKQTPPPTPQTADSPQQTPQFDEEDLKIIEGSELFDPVWYREKYGADSPALHYLTEGWKQGFDPSERFSTDGYFENNPDVEDAGLNPLVHYEKHGRAEGRSFPIFNKGNFVPLSREIAHGKWPAFLSERFNKPGCRILEMGSRVVTGANLSDRFDKADYTGFDIYEGPNVDVVGDAHRLSSYFPEGTQFDLIYTSAVFEHLAMPWIVANEMIKLLKVGGHIFVETHYSYSAHERPWHFFQFSDQALKVLFSPAHGIECIEAGVSDPMVGTFTNKAHKKLAGTKVYHIYCHSQFFGKKVREVPDFSYDRLDISEVTLGTHYPEPKD